MAKKKERLNFNIVILGMIASGKDTQALILQDKYELHPVESGKYWRKLTKENSPDGQWLRRTVSKGLPAPVELMKKFLVREIDKKPKNKDLIFVGNPRLKPEAQLLKKIMAEKKQQFFALYISLPENKVYERSLGRKAIKNHKLAGMLDTQKLIASRINWHKKQVLKTVAYFASLKKMKVINGNQPIEKVTADIEKAIVGFKKQLK